MSFAKGGHMEGLVALLAITLVDINFCCMVYLAKTGIKTVFKLIGLRELLEEAGQS